MNFSRFYNQYSHLLRIFLLSLAILMISRLNFIWTFGQFNDLQGRGFDLVKAFYIGLKFDIQAISYGLAIPFALSLSLLFVKARQSGYYNFVKRMTYIFSLLMLAIFLLLLIIDFYFFRFFQFHVNVLFWGLFQDNTTAIFKSVWTDFPTFRIILCYLLLLGFFSFLLRKILSKEYNNPYSASAGKVLFVSTLVLLYGLGMRGSLGKFALKNEDAMVSNNAFVNAIGTNGIFTFKNGISDLSIQYIDTDYMAELKKNGFSSPQEAVGQYLGRKIDPNEDIIQSLLSTTKTDTFLTRNPPNVIFLQMESFGNHILNYHSPEFNLLGSLENQLDACILFRNFLSYSDGTIETLEGFLVNNPFIHISQSIYMNVALSTSCAIPYQKAGYRTNFVTSSQMGWRNMDQFIKNQHFDHVEGCEIIESKIPETKINEWGAYDEFLMNRIFQILNEDRDKPNFIFGMSCTNHTPFTLPDTFKPLPLNIPSSIKDLIVTNEELALKNFTGYQYGANCLGRLIEKIRNSKFRDNTIIAATGDHNARQVFDYKDSQLLQKHGVPLLLYVPEKYLKNCRVDTSCIGSHRDIFPTLYNLSLSGATYLNTGVNLLDSATPKNNDAVTNYFLVAFSKEGCVSLPEPLFYKWQTKNPLLLEPTSPEQSPHLLKLMQRAKAYKASMSFFIQKDILRFYGKK